MNVGILIFGEDSSFPADNIILEYKQFIEANTYGKLRLNLSIGKYPPIPLSEIGSWDGTSPCYFLSPYSISDNTKAHIPKNSQVNILAWNYEGVKICWGGGTWGGDVGTNGVPFISIPFAWAPAEPWGPWKYTYGQTFVHEFLHALTILSGNLGYPVQYSADDCRRIGYESDPNASCVVQSTCTYDPGWANCYKNLLNQIPNAAYTAIEQQACSIPVTSFTLS